MNCNLIYKNFFTQVFEAAAVLSTRPLTAVSNDVLDIEALTTSHSLLSNMLEIQLFSSPPATEDLFDEKGKKMTAIKRTIKIDVV